MYVWWVQSWKQIMKQIRRAFWKARSIFFCMREYWAFVRGLCSCQKKEQNSIKRIYWWSPIQLACSSSKYCPKESVVWVPKPKFSIFTQWWHMKERSRIMFHGLQIRSNSWWWEVRKNEHKKGKFFRHFFRSFKLQRVTEPRLDIFGIEKKNFKSLICVSAWI